MNWYHILKDEAVAYTLQFYFNLSQKRKQMLAGNFSNIQQKDNVPQLFNVTYFMYTCICPYATKLV